MPNTRTKCSSAPAKQPTDAEVQKAETLVQKAKKAAARSSCSFFSCLQTAEIWTATTWLDYRRRRLQHPEFRWCMHQDRQATVTIKNLMSKQSLNTEGQKTHPMISTFGKIALLWETETPQRFVVSVWKIAFSLSFQVILILFWLSQPLLRYCIFKMVTHWMGFLSSIFKNI